MTHIISILAILAALTATLGARAEEHRATGAIPIARGPEQAPVCKPPAEESWLDLNVRPMASGGGGDYIFKRLPLKIAGFSKIKDDVTDLLKIISRVQVNARYKYCLVFTRFLGYGEHVPKDPQFIHTGKEAGDIVIEARVVCQMQELIEWSEESFCAFPRYMDAVLFDFVKTFERHVPGVTVIDGWQGPRRGPPGTGGVTGSN